MDERRLREAIVEIGRRLYERGYIVASDGNISARLPESGHIVTTPTGVCKGFLTPDMLVVVDAEGRKLNGTLAPSSELAMHLEIYRQRPDVHAVVHAHPPCGTGFAAAGLSLDEPLVSEIVLTLGSIPLAGYGTPSTQELAEAIAPYVPHYNALLLANHGAVTYGPDLETAYFRMETLEHCARITLVAKLLGRERPLSAEAVRKLFQIRERAGMTVPNPSPQRSSETAPSSHETLTLTRQQLVHLIAEAVEAALRFLKLTRMTWRS
jgi:L-fuculose-phosphate aldolase